MPTMSVHDIPDLSDNHDRFLDPSSEGHDIDDNVRHVAATQIDFAMRGTNFQFVQEEIVDHSEVQGAPGPSDPLRLLSTMIVDVSSPPSGELSSESVAHNYPSSPHGHAGTAQGLNALAQASQRRERKKDKDKTRKRNQRSRKAQDEESICDLLEIPLKPKNTLAHRSEYLCIYPRLEY